MQKTGTPNEYRKELKKKILVFTMNEFVTYGLKAVKMDYVAKSLGISKRTVYEIYKDKEEILVDGMMHQFEMAEKKLQDAYSKCDNVIELLATFYRIHMMETAKVHPIFYADVEKYPKAMKLILDKSKERDQRAIEFFQTGVKEGYFREDIDYDIIMYIGKYTSQSIMERQLFNKYPMQKLFRNVMFLYIRGFCTLKGVELLDKLIE